MANTWQLVNGDRVSSQDYDSTALTLQKEASVAGASFLLHLSSLLPQNRAPRLSQTNHHPTQRLHFPSSLATRSGNKTKSASMKRTWTWMVHLEVYLKVSTTSLPRPAVAGRAGLQHPPGPQLQTACWEQWGATEEGGFLELLRPACLPLHAQVFCTANLAPVR